MRFFSAKYYRQLVRIAILTKDFNKNSVLVNQNRFLISKVYRKILKDSNLTKNKTYIYEKSFWEDSQARLFFYGMGFNLNEEESTISWKKETDMK